MPTYDYACKGCGHAFEHFQSMTDKKLRKCPACAERKLERLIGTGAGVIFKGSGFYETDYKKKPVRPDRGKEDSDSGGSSSDAGGSDTASTSSTAKDDPAPQVKTPQAESKKKTKPAT